MDKGNLFAAMEIAKVRYGDDANAVGSLKSLAQGGFSKIEKAAEGPILGAIEKEQEVGTAWLAA